MSESLKKWLKTKKEIPPKAEAILNLRVASNLLVAEFEKFINKHGITEAQFNVLRILKGVHPDGHPRCEIITRMIDRSPDITRLIDRLEKQGLVLRDRNSNDRRHSLTKISKKGLSLLEKIQPEFKEQTKRLTKKLTNEECKVLSVLTEKLYEDYI